MSKHLFGLVLTPLGVAANNRGENQGNIATLQKILWKGEVHSTISAEAIRWAIRLHWQNCFKNLNRRWNSQGLKPQHEWQDKDFKRWQEFIDDDVLGFMSAQAAKEEHNDEDGLSKGNKAKGTTRARRGRLEITRAISLTPYEGDVSFNVASIGASTSASSTGIDPVPYVTEVHATHYQYGFAITPEDLAERSRVLDVIDAITSLSEVAGNQARFLYDFAPESIIFRWTDDFAPRMLYGFLEASEGEISLPEILQNILNGDIDPQEVVLGGSICKSPKINMLSKMGAFIGELKTADTTGEISISPAGVKQAAEEVKRRIKRDLAIA